MITYDIIDNQVAGEEEEQTPVWQLLYSASTDLGLTGVGPDDWMEVIMMIMMMMLVRICWGGYHAPWKILTFCSCCCSTYFLPGADQGGQ